MRYCFPAEPLVRGPDSSIQRQMLQWIAALERVARDCHYTGKNRFDSFAPIRLNVAAQWLVDGVSPTLLRLQVQRLTQSQRDYFWNLSRAMMLATECIYIHDWWLSPGKYRDRCVLITVV